MRLRIFSLVYAALLLLLLPFGLAEILVNALVALNDLGQLVTDFLSNR
jgi:hypothetical protein